VKNNQYIIDGYLWYADPDHMEISHKGKRFAFGSNDLLEYIDEMGFDIVETNIYGVGFLSPLSGPPPPPGSPRAPFVDPLDLVNYQDPEICSSVPDSSGPEEFHGGKESSSKPLDVTDPGLVQDRVTVVPAVVSAVGPTASSLCVSGEKKKAFPHFPSLWKWEMQGGKPTVVDFSSPPTSLPVPGTTRRMGLWGFSEITKPLFPIPYNKYGLGILGKSVITG
jgi:hypothetical protein